MCPINCNVSSSAEQHIRTAARTSQTLDVFAITVFRSLYLYQDPQRVRRVNHRALESQRASRMQWMAHTALYPPPAVTFSARP